MVAPNSCDPCGTCIPANVGNTFFKQAALAALCGNQDVLELILIALGGGTGVELLSESGRATAAGETVVIAAAAGQRLRIMAYSLQTNSTVDLLVRMLDGPGGSEIWRTRFQAPADIVVGSNLSTSSPSFLFQTSVGGSLVLELSAAEDVDYNFTYWAA